MTCIYKFIITVSIIIASVLQISFNYTYPFFVNSDFTMFLYLNISIAHIGLGNFIMERANDIAA